MCQYTSKFCRWNDGHAFYMYNTRGCHTHRGQWVVTVGSWNGTTCNLHNNLKREMVIFNSQQSSWGFLVGASGKESTCRCRRCKRHRLDPWVGKIPLSRKWQSTQYSCLENPMDRVAWRVTVNGVLKSDMTEQLSMHTCTVEGTKPHLY